MVDLTDIFGDAISVATQPCEVAWQYHGYAGAHGLTALCLGSRGRSIIITGRISADGNDYATARAALRAAIAEIEEYTFADSADYTFKNDTYYSVIFGRLQIIPDGNGIAFHYIPGGAFANFVCQARGLI